MIKKLFIPIFLIAISVFAIYCHICTIIQAIGKLGEWNSFIGLQAIEGSTTETLIKIAPREIFTLTHISISHALYMFVDCIFIAGAVLSLAFLIKNVFYKIILIVPILLLIVAFILFINFSMLFYTYGYGIIRFYMGAIDTNLSITYLCFALFCCFLIIISIILLKKSKKYIIQYKNKNN